MKIELQAPAKVNLYLHVTGRREDGYHKLVTRMQKLDYCDRLVLELLRRARRRVPLVVVLAGGYGGGTWRYSARFFSWLITGKVAKTPVARPTSIRSHGRFRQVTSTRTTATTPLPSPTREMVRQKRPWFMTQFLPGCALSTPDRMGA